MAGLGIWYALTPTRALWTYQDLPPSPPEEDNGWLLIAAWGNIERPDPLPNEIVDGGLFDQFLDVEPQVAPSALEANRTRIEEAVGSPEMAELIRVARRAVAMPHFVEACDHEGDWSRCANPGLPAMRQVLGAAALAAAAAGDSAGALDIASKSVEAHLQFVRFTRTSVGFRGGVEQASRSLRTLEQVLSITSEQGLSSDEWRATRHRLLLALRAYVADPPRLTHYVTHLYRWERTHLEHLHSLTLFYWPPARVRSSRADRYFSALHRYATDPAAPPPEVPPAHTHAVALDMKEHLDRQRRALEELTADVERLTSMLERQQ